MHDAIEEIALKAIEDKTFPGCIIGVFSNGTEHILPFGTLAYDVAERVCEDTIYDVASVTKSIPTASLALALLHDGELQLTDPITKYVPELKNHYSATIEDLLRYRVVGPRLSDLRASGAQELRERIHEIGFDRGAGESTYTNLPSYILGEVLVSVSGKPLDQLAREHFFTPLEMHDTSYWPEDIHRCAPTEIVDGRTLRGIVHDESARVFTKEHIAVGHAGLFSTALDLLKFLRSLLVGKNPAVLAGAQKGLGWQVGEATFMGTRASSQTIGKTGFTGASMLLEVDRGVALVILANRTYPKRPADNTAINTFRCAIADIVLSA